MRHEVYSGRGFALLRGLDVNAYSVDDSTIIYLGIQCYIGNKFGRQDKKGNMMGKCSDLLPQASSTNTDSAHCRRQLLTQHGRPSPSLHSTHCKLDSTIKWLRMC